MARANVDSLYPSTLDPMSSADVIMRHAYGGNARAIDYSSRYGLLRDDSRLVESIEGRRSYGSGVANPFRSGSGSVSLRSFGGGESDPGRRNYATLSRTAQGTGQLLAEAYNFGAERYETSSGQLDYSDPSKRFPGFRFGNTPMYQNYRGKQQKIGQQTRLARLGEARLEKQAQAQEKQAQAQKVQDVQDQLTANTQGYNAVFNPDLDYVSQYGSQLAAQLPTYGPRPPSTPTTNRRNPSVPRVKYNPQTGQRQTNTGLVIPPGTRSL